MKKFIEATKNRKPVVFLPKIIDDHNIKSGYALDLGCGVGVDARYLAENGFKVEAVDINNVSVEQTKSTCKGLDVDVIKENINNFEIKQGKYSLIISWNSLPFLEKKEAEKVMKNIQSGLKKGGFFVFGLFGPEDDWVKTKKGMSFFSVDEFRNILPGMEFIEVIEKREIASSVNGEEKFWHKIQGMARKN